MADIHDQALEWAQANPEDPRAQAVMAKAWVAKNPDDPRTAAILAKLQGGSNKPTPEHEPGIIEALARGAEQGLTFGFGDEINAALEATLKGGQGDWLDRYRTSRDQSRALFNAAEEAHPAASIAGNIVGGLVPAFFSGGATAAASGAEAAASVGLKEAAKQGLKMGAGYGALSGLGTTDADLTKGDIKEAAKDVASGAVLGGALGGAVNTAAAKYGHELEDYLLKLGKAGKEGVGVATDLGPIQLTKKSFEHGLKGTRLIGEEAKNRLNNQAIEEAENLVQQVQQALSKPTSEKIKLLADSKNSIDISGWTKNVLDLIKRAQTEYPYPDSASDISKILDTINSVIQTSGTKIDAVAAENLLRKLGKMGAMGDEALKTSEGRAVIHRIISPLNRNDLTLAEATLGVNKDMPTLDSLIEKAVPGVDELNAKISPLMQAKEMIPDSGTIAKAGKTHISGTEAAKKIDDFLAALPKEMAEKEGQRVGELSEAIKVAEKIAAPGLSHGLLADTSRGVLYGGANIAGLGVKAMYDLSPEMIQNIAKAVYKGGSAVHEQLGKIIEQAAAKDRIGRNAILFAIQQNPKYREIIDGLTGGKPNVK